VGSKPANGFKRARYDIDQMRAEWRRVESPRRLAALEAERVAALGKQARLRRC
jgi:hypothetical protein